MTTLCECGCGQATPIADSTRRGYVRGESMRFVHGHNGRLRSSDEWARAVARVIAGDSRLHSQGYRMFYLPMHQGTTRSYVYEHRLVMERQLGRFLTTNEHVHHINGNRLDNSPGNLELVDPRAHRLIHTGVTDDEIVAFLQAGLTSRQIEAKGVSSHRVVRVRRLCGVAA